MEKNNLKKLDFQSYESGILISFFSPNLDAFSLFANDNKMFNKNKVSQMCNKFKEVSNLLSMHLDSNEYSNLKVDEIIENMDDIIIRMNDLKDNII
jgi:hypothetical protein